MRPKKEKKLLRRSKRHRSLALPYVLRNLYLATVVGRGRDVWLSAERSRDVPIMLGGAINAHSKEEHFTCSKLIKF